MYFDYAGCALPQYDTLRSSFNLLTTTTFTNPHSYSNPSSQELDYVTRCRETICALFNTTLEEYTPIFTANATSAIKMVGELINYNNFYYTKANHNSVVNIRSLAISKDANVFVLDDELRVLDTLHTSKTPQPVSYPLVAFPAECNFSGKKYPLSLINTCKETWGPNTLVLLDAAKYTSTSRLCLDVFKPDFVPISLYKLVGYPTGLGVLMVKNTARDAFHKIYFGGGTLDHNIADALISKPRDDFISRMEDGTIPFITIMEAYIALQSFIKTLDEDEEHIHYMSQLFHDKLASLKHPNGNPLAVIYGWNDNRHTYRNGSIVTCNFLNEGGYFIGYKDVEHMLKNAGITVRVGCCCNPGACATYLQLTTEETIKHTKLGHKCWDNKELIDGRPTGAVRFSFGRQTTYDEITLLVDTLCSLFITNVDVMMRDMFLSNQSTLHEQSKVQIVDICLYPVKGCQPFHVKSWNMTLTGLQYDRHFVVVDDKHRVVTLKANHNLGRLHPTIVFDDENRASVVIRDSQSGESITVSCDKSLQVEDDVHVWLTSVLRRSCDSEGRKYYLRHDGLHNSHPVLVCNVSSLHDLQMRIASKNMGWTWKTWCKVASYVPSILSSSVSAVTSKLLEKTVDVVMDRFRPNIVISGVKAYDEDNISEMKISAITLHKEADCGICYTSVVNPTTLKNDESLEPMQTLLTYRKREKGVMFGAFFDVIMPPSRDTWVVSVDSPLSIV